MNAPKIVEKIIVSNKDEFVKKFGQEAVDDLLLNKKSLKTMVEEYEFESVLKDSIEDAFTCFILNK
ncbi:hypothetical protein [Clostridium sp.]|uniref:hypothetical protein n=1 Tax=Clostridium sp. TaxID=1506 RepID=UPI0025B9FDC2|nr:hypothetical protein [Clostridium sp.]